MKRTLLMFCSCLIFSAAIAASAQTSPKIITGPNYYYFMNTTYYADVGATNAAIAVNMSPGSPAWSGSVDYSSQDGTGIAGKDYTAVSGTIWFSGPAARGFNVPVTPGPAEKTVTLTLSNPNSGYITTGSATLIIPAAPPAAAIRRGTNAIWISWDARYTNYVVEVTTNLWTPSWTAVTGGLVQSNGVSVMKVAADKPSAFFRLHQQ